MRSFQFLHRSFLRTAVSLTLAGLLALGCGGSGGDSPLPPTPVPVPTLVVNLPSISIAETVARQSAVTSSVAFTIENMPAGQVYLRSQATSSIVRSLAVTQTGVNTGNLNVTLMSPNLLTAGLYSDTITFSACLESPCVNPIAGSPVTIPVQFTVSRPSGSQAPRLSSSQTVINTNAFRLSRSSPQTRATYTINNFSSTSAYTGAYTSLTATTNGISYAPYVSSSSNGTNDINLSLRQPTTLAVGRYNDTVTVTACFDPQCLNHFDGSPLNFTVTYDILDTSTDANGNRTMAIQIDANDLAWDATHAKFYVSLPSSAGTGGNSIRRLDPQTGQLDAAVFVGSEPRALAVSNDGQYLYVALTGAGTVSRRILPSLAADQSITLGLGSNGLAYQAQQIAVSPQDPKTIAIMRDSESYSNSYYSSVQIFDETTPRSQTAGYGSNGTLSGLTSLAWGGSNTSLYTTSTTYPGYLYQFSVTASGLSHSNSTSGFTNYSNGEVKAHFDADRIYSDDGNIFSVASQSVIGSVGSQRLSRTIPDSSLGKIFGFTTYDGVSYGPRIIKYDINTMTPIGSMDLPLESYTNISRLQRWGTNGLAFLVRSNGTDPGYIVLVSGPLISQ